MVVKQHLWAMQRLNQIALDQQRAQAARGLRKVQGIAAGDVGRTQAAEEAQRARTAGLYGDLMGAGRGLVGLGELERGTGIECTDA